MVGYRRSPKVRFALRFIAMNPHRFGKLLVTLQFGLIAALAVLCAPQTTEQLPGQVSIVFWLASVILGLWTLSANRPGNFNIRPEPRSEGHLIMTGPYRWIRHPMYTSVLLLAAGASTWLADLTGVVIWLALLAVLIAKARLEERWLVLRYPDYQTYRKGTWRLVPGLY